MRNQAWFLAVSLLLAAAAYQNCAPHVPGSSVNSGVTNVSINPTLLPEHTTKNVAGFVFNPEQFFSPQCKFNGKVIEEGQSVIAYASSTDTAGSGCVSQNRVCQNGILWGSGEYASCSENTHASCLFNGQQINDGGSVQAFFNGSSGGSACQSETRVCNNGVLSGSATYGECSEGVSGSCQFNGTTLSTGQSVNAFAVSKVSEGQFCQVSQRVCMNGVLTGTGEYAECTQVSGSGLPASVMSFVGETQASCEAAVLNHTGQTVKCTMGGACGTTCGIPGSQCASSQPELWGACLAQSP